MRIFRAKTDDNNGILRLYMQFNEERIKAGVGDAQYRYIEGETPWKKTLVDEECETFVAKERGIILGFITVRIPQYNPFNKVGKLAEVDLIVVERKLRRRGIGTILYETAKDALKKVGVTHILLNVKVGNIPAMNFWVKKGFRKVSGTSYTRADGHEEKTVYMVNKI